MVTFFTHGDVINAQTWEVPPKKSSRATLASRYCPEANGEAESEVRIAKKILKQRDPFALVGDGATPHASTGVSHCQLMRGIDIHTLLPIYNGILVAAGSPEP